MAAFSSIALGIAAAAAAATAGYTINSSIEAEEKQDAMMAQQKADAEKQQAEFKAEQDRVKADMQKEKETASTLDRANAGRNDAISQARARSAGGAGASSTILTSPLGLPNAIPGGGKTLLGM